MSDDEFITVDDPELADVTLLRGVETTETPPARLRFLPGREFIEQELGRIDPLVGTPDDALLMPGSLAILAGVGGSGKTTLALHAMAHWASGVPWFGIPTPRPLRIVVIENEGPHDPFVKKVRDFARRWKNCPCCDDAHGDGGDYIDNCLFLDAPWGHFTFEEPALALELKEAVKGFQADLVLANPLSRLGMKGAGTPEDTRTFLQLLFAAGLNDVFAALLLHHFTKAVHKNDVDKLSGDWGPHPDTIMLLEPEAERRNKLTFGKIRWGDQGRAPFILNWLDDPEGPIGYRGESAPQGVTDDDMFDRIDAYLVKNQGANMTAIRSGVQGNGRRIGDLVKAGVSDGRFSARGEGRKRVYFAGDLPPEEPEIAPQEDFGF